MSDFIYHMFQFVVQVELVVDAAVYFKTSDMERFQLAAFFFSDEFD